MKGLILYRILSIVVNFFALLMTFAFIPFLLMVFSNAGFALILFIIACIILYAWYANRFFVKVIMRREPFTKKQIDMLQVNAIVVFIFSLISVQGGVSQMMNPSAMPVMPAEMAESMPSNDAMQVIVGISLLLSVILLIHVIWTFLLLRSYKKASQNNQT